MKEITLDAVVENVDPVTDFVTEQLEEVGCSAKATMQIAMAIDEIFSNISYYAYTPDVGKATVRVEVIEDRMEVVLTFLDNGIPYNPMKAEDPDITSPASERELGGLGIFLVKKNMDKIDYEYRDGRNILRLRKGMD